MFNLFSRIETENVVQKHQLLQKIRNIETGIGVDTIKSLDSTAFHPLMFKIAREVDGIILKNSNSFINFEEKIIFNLKGESEIEENYENFDNLLKERLIRERRIWKKILRKNKVRINYGLPYTENESEVKLRSLEQIVQRTIALSIVTAKGIIMEDDVTLKLIERYKAEIFFTPDEKEFIKTKIEEIDQQTREIFIWRFQSCLVLLWSLGFIDSMEYPLGKKKILKKI